MGVARRVGRFFVMDHAMGIRTVIVNNAHLLNFLAQE